MGLHDLEKEQRSQLQTLQSLITPRCDQKSSVMPPVQGKQLVYITILLSQILEGFILPA